MHSVPSLHYPWISQLDLDTLCGSLTLKQKIYHSMLCIYLCINLSSIIYNLCVCPHFIYCFIYC